MRVSIFHSTITFFPVRFGAVCVLWCDSLVFFFRTHELNKSSLDFIQPETSKAKIQISFEIRYEYASFCIYKNIFIAAAAIAACFPCLIFNEKEEKVFCFPRESENGRQTARKRERKKEKNITRNEFKLLR